MTALELETLLKDQQEGQLLQIHARPKPHLNIAGVDFTYSVIPALYLSGDSLDYFLLPDGRVLAYLLDVSGSGTAAALLCMFIKSLVRYSVAITRNITAAAVLQDVNQRLLDAQVGKHATMVCCIIDAEQNTLQWSNAGHTPRPVFFTDTQTDIQLGNGQPIGLFAQAEYDTVTLSLPETFSFVIFSDGILDCLEQNSFVEREIMLKDVVQKANGCFTALYEALELANCKQMPDDISMLVISRSVL